MSNPILNSLPQQQATQNPIMSRLGLFKAAMTGDTKAIFDQMRGNPALNGKSPEEAFAEFSQQVQGLTPQQAFAKYGQDFNQVQQEMSTQ